MSAFLVPLDPGLCLIPLEKAIVLIGRQADCDVSLTHSRKVSRKHCCIAQVNDSYVVRDLGSTNGIFVNGTRVRKETGLALGDELAIGDVRFRLQLEASSKSSKAQIDDARNVRGGTPRPVTVVPQGADKPVVLDDMNADFIVEASIPQMRSLKHRKSEDDVVPLASDSF